MEELTNAIAVLRAARQISQTELAEAIGVSRKTISTVETGRFTPSVVIALKLAKFFEVPVEVLQVPAVGFVGLSPEDSGFSADRIPQDRVIEPCHLENPRRVMKVIGRTGTGLPFYGVFEFRSIPKILD